jgi:hypothetical protein
MTINNLSILTTTASASLGNIVVSNENNDDGLTTRQGASFDDKHNYSHSIIYSLGKPRQYYDVVLQTESTIAVVSLRLTEVAFALVVKSTYYFLLLFSSSTLFFYLPPEVATTV